MPAFVAAAVEPAFGILADSGRRRTVVVVGGAAFGAALAVAASAGTFAVLLGAFIVLWSASGAFVSVSQATLMDLDPQSRERNMAKWVLVGSAGALCGPLVVAAGALAGVSWRFTIAALAFVGVMLTAGAIAAPATFPAPSDSQRFWALASEAIRQLRNREVLRWLVVLELTNLMLDVFLSYLALYFVDVLGTTAATGGLAVAVWIGAGLAGEAAMLPALKRVSGLQLLRASAPIVLLLFGTFLFVPSTTAKLVCVAALALFTAGWYPIPNARLYAALPERSGVVVALSSLAAVIGAVLPLVVAALAARFGLGRALWLCVLAPVTLWALVPRSD